MTAAITDFTQYSGLRMGAAENDPAALKNVAGQFEALFLQSMLKSMRDASPGDPLFGDSDAHEMYQDMLDQQLAMEMASGKGIGLAEMLVRQLGGEKAAGLSPGQGFEIERDGRSIEVERRGASFELERGSGEFHIGRGGTGIAIQSKGPVPSASAKPSWDNPQSFARDVWPHAKRVARQLNVPPEGVLAQAALETGWGRHVTPGHNGETSLNLFGIKAGNSWSGDSVARRTVEFDGDVASHRVARFRAYKNVADSFNDYANLITASARYSDVRGHGNDVEGFASALQRSGYATDPQYAEKISRVANSDTMARVLENLKIPERTPIAR